MQALWMLLAALLFATMGVCIKFASAYFTSFEVVFYRGLIGLAFMTVVMRVRGVSLATPVPAMHLWRSIVGTTLGTWAAVVPLTVAVAPFIARLVETALREVDAGLIEAAQSMGATTSQIVCKVLLPEAMPGIVAALTISLVSLTGYSAMAGAVGGGGLGDLGIRYGYQRFLPDVMLAVVVILIVFVQLIQSFGDWLVRRISHR